MAAAAAARLPIHWQRAELAHSSTVEKQCRRMRLVRRATGRSASTWRSVHPEYPVVTEWYRVSEDPLLETKYHGVPGAAIWPR